MGTENRLLLIDALNLIRRVYAAQQSADDGASEERLRERIESTVRSLRRALKETEPTHAVAVFDGRGETWRHEIFPEYKAGREPMPEELAEALPAFRKAFLDLGVASFERPATEADDVLATLATKVVEAGGKALILATDKGYLQLLPRGVRVRDHFRQLDLLPGLVRERFGVPADRLVDLFALAGDGTTSIPGVPGIGLKTAAALLDAYGDLDGVVAAAEALAAGGERETGSALTPRRAEKIAAQIATIHLARRLAALRTDLELGINLRDFRLTSIRGRE